MMARKCGIMTRGVPPATIGDSIWEISVQAIEAEVEAFLKAHGISAEHIGGRPS
jgi:hypothetical protein